jgi:ribose transport system substrate-binding protein
MGVSIAWHRAGRVLSGVVVLAAAVSLAACGSAGGAAGTSGSATAASAQAAASGSGVSAQLAAAEAAVTALRAAPAGLTGRTPLPSAPARGKTIVYLQCELEQCHTFQTGVAAAAQVIGWNTQTIDFTSSDLSTLIAAFATALRYNPVAVVYSGTSVAQFQAQVFPAYEKAKVPIIPIAVGATTVSSVVPAAVFDGGYDTQASDALADWFIADSKAAGQALVVNVPFIDVINQAGLAIQADIKSNCSGCGATAFDATAGELADGSLVSAVVAAARKEPGLGYILLSDAALFSGLPAALESAGLSNVKVAGIGPSTENIQDLKQGTESAFILLADQMFGWAAVDIAVRHDAGLPVAANDGGLPLQLADSTNKEQAASDGYIAPPNFEQLFEKLWHLN